MLRKIRIPVHISFRTHTNCESNNCFFFLSFFLFLTGTKQYANCRQMCHSRVSNGQIKTRLLFYTKKMKNVVNRFPHPHATRPNPRAIVGVGVWGGGGGGIGWGGGGAGGRIMRTTSSLLKRLFHFHVTRWVARSEPGVSRLWSFCGHCGRSPHETPDNRLDTLHTTAS